MRSTSARHDYEKCVGRPPPQWVTDVLTKEQSNEFRKWDALDLRSMAKRRDALPPLTELQIGKETLEHHYDTIYAQFSSVAHFDMYSLELVRLHLADDSSVELRTDDHWPSLLMLQNCEFDIIQCFEATHAYYHKDAASQFNKLLLDWYRLVGQMNLPGSSSN